MKTVVKRTLSGATFIVLTVGAILAGAAFSISLFLIYALLTQRELYQILWHKEEQPPPSFLQWLGLLAGFGLYMSSAFWVYPFRTFSLLVATNIALVLLAFAVILLFFVGGWYVVVSRRPNPFLDWGKMLLGIFYVVLPFTLVPLLIVMSVPGHVSWYLLLPLILTWINDTGAYCVGVPLGRHRLIERVSPGKSVEGFVGGLIFSMVGGALIAWLVDFRTPLFGALLGLVVGLVAVLGDLVESKLKRSVEIKDSGTFLPGHGGFLDRFDSLIFVLPVAGLFSFLT